MGDDYYETLNSRREEEQEEQEEQEIEICFLHNYPYLQASNPSTSEQ